MSAETIENSEPTIQDFSPDRPIVPQMVAHVMEALNQSEDAAYMVYLKLAIRFGSGQKCLGSEK